MFGKTLRIKDFKMMEVKDVHGKKLGFIKDIEINFYEGKVEGFIISSYKIFQRTLLVTLEDVISFSNSMIVKGAVPGGKLYFDKIKGMDLVDSCGNILGIVEDLIIDSQNFKILGIIASTGFLKNLFTGKKIFLINFLLLGEEYIFCFEEECKIQLISKPHGIEMEEKSDEKEN